ncbi:DUF362 domain-containing protein [Halanaerobium sp. Z-7514]|uniref:DUF362 domain-containing protein n=1 Tax=Halanaerobium polyolivorans TaxID=2886943 RepID=A0AAW4WRZ6_9FIRM|nr:DUF362 domain-containing protein [Halanaerobium polyolivorans]MCC3143877.1 DUF362 domain-containing protein [Halanaerobium polyolivorans]RQD75159.1 MAG: DUF362 domain-containing protein [Halanaerobium sp. MSAO_Bac5]
MSTKVAISKFDSLKGNEEFIGGDFKRYDEDIAEIKIKLKEVIEASVGSIANLIKNGDRVLIKPNLAFLAPPESFSVVDPRVIEALVSLLKEESEAGEVWVGDNPSLGKHVGRAKPAFKAAEMEEAAYRGGADRVLYFDEEASVKVDIPMAKVFKKASVFRPILDADVVINLPKMKTHLGGTVTLGLKNWQGIIPNVHPSGEQQDTHRIDLDQKIADLLRIRKADLTIVDSIIAMEGQGPHAGTPVEMNLLIAGEDTVAVDSLTSYIMGYEPHEVPSTQIAFSEGQGEMRLEEIEVAGVDADSVRRFFKRPSSNPVGLIPGVDVLIQQTCPGCYKYVRGALDSFKGGIDTERFVEENGESLIIAGGVPSLDYNDAVGKHLFVVGDCWKKFESSEEVEKAMEVAADVTEYPGCAPIYVFAQLNADLQALDA